MCFVTVRDLRNKPAKIRETLSTEQDVILTANGKPFAIMSSISEDTLESSLSMMRRIRTEQAVAALQRQSLETGRDRITSREIDEEIRTVRRKRA